MEFKDYYAILGLKPAASADDIKRAYRSLARKYHPDLNKAAGAEERFKQVSEAYEALRDPEKRAAYDEAARRWKAGPPPAGPHREPPPGWDAGFEFSGGFGGEGPGEPAYSSFFESLFGRGSAAGTGARGGRRGAQGSDHHAKVLVDLADAYTGATRPIRLRMPVSDANGRVALAERVLDVHVPRGIREGRVLRLKGQGGTDPLGSGAAGDLYLELHFKPHPYFRVNGADVTLDLPVAPWEAALGARVAVPAPDRRVELSIPPNSGQGRKLRLRGLGLPPSAAGEPAGDLYVVLQIALPAVSTEEAKALYRQMEKTMQFNPRASMGG